MPPSDDLRDSPALRQEGPQQERLFVSKPRTITAEQFFHDKPLPFHGRGPYVAFKDGRFYVTTAHGQTVDLVDGDWVIPEPSGPHVLAFAAYPVKPDIFAATYDEPALSASRTAQQACIGCGTTGPLVGFTFEHQPGPFCCVCWKALKTSFIELDADEASRTAPAPQQDAWALMDRIYKKVCAMTPGLPQPTTAFYDFGVPILAEILAALQARIQVLETSVDYLRYLVDHPVTQELWRPIETAKEDGEIVLVFDEGAMFRALIEKGRWIDIECDQPIVPPPSHWMPMPSPPSIAPPVAPAEGEQ